MECLIRGHLKLLVFMCGTCETIRVPIVRRELNCVHTSSGWPLLAFTAKQPPMSSTDHDGGKRRPFIAALSSATRGELSHRDDQQRQPWPQRSKTPARPRRSRG